MDHHGPWKCATSFSTFERSTAVPFGLPGKKRPWSGETTSGPSAPGSQLDAIGDLRLIGLGLLSRLKRALHLKKRLFCYALYKSCTLQSNPTSLLTA